jgi:hypothetical protein
MKNENIIKNLTIKQINQSDALGFNKDFISKAHDVNFDLLGKAFANTAKTYAKLKIAIDNNTCESENCVYEINQLKIIEQAPQVSLDFLSSLISQLQVTESENFDPNNNFEYTVANCILNERPGFSKSDGYDAYLDLLQDGSQQITFYGPMFVQPLVINSVSLQALGNVGTTIVASTPDLPSEMMSLLSKIGLFTSESIMENGKLSPNAKISEEFVLKNPDGSFDYEIIDIGNGKGRNILKYDMDKIERKASPFITAEIAGLLNLEQQAVAAWNVYLSEGKYWSYTEDLPLYPDKQKEFEKKYKDYFMNNYLKQFVENQLPTNPQDAAIFDLQQAKMAKAQAFIEANNL